MRRRHWSDRRVDPVSPQDLIHQQYGIWEVWTLRARPASSKLATDWIPRLVSTWKGPIDRLLDDLPYITRMFREVLHLAPTLWLAYLMITAIQSFLPSIELYFSGQLLEALQSAVEHRTVDGRLLIQAAVGAAVSNMAERVLRDYGATPLHQALISRIRDHYEGYVLHALSRLDLPTSEDAAVQEKFDRHNMGSGGAPWELIRSIQTLVIISLQALSQMAVLINLLRNQRDSTSLVLWTFAGPLLRWIEDRDASSSFAAFIENSDYRTKTGIEGLLHLSSFHRKEVIAGNMSGYLLAAHQRSTNNLAAQNSLGDWPHRNIKPKSKITIATRFLRDALSESPKIVFALQAIDTPASIPLSIVTLQLVQSQVTRFMGSLRSVLQSNMSLTSEFEAIRELYGLGQIENQIKDGTDPYPDPDKKERGASLEFKNVSFRYPAGTSDVVHNVSFAIGSGQLCVLVGANGQGKSSILKLITRLYDPTEGVILLDGKPLQSYKLEDIRRATSVLFQDFTIFPLSVGENISIGDPGTQPSENPSYRLRLQEAAKLGGINEYISATPEGFDSMTEASPPSWICGGVEGRAIMTAVNELKGRSKRQARSAGPSMSGGQKQRLALARTFMRPSEEVDLLLYDEPSAALDPAAEYELFERLRALRQEKTMLFSTHRFGYLTKHADIILYMKDSTIAEAGTHEELLALGGGYANLYQLQAQAFQ